MSKELKARILEIETTMEHLTLKEKELVKKYMLEGAKQELKELIEFTKENDWNGVSIGALERRLKKLETKDGALLETKD